MKNLIKASALLLLLAAFVAPAAAQSLTGVVTGTVKDEQGGALPGVAVTLTGKTGSKTTKGVVALVLMVAGAGYVAYRIPKDNEKVHSPIR